MRKEEIFEAMNFKLVDYAYYSAWHIIVLKNSVFPLYPVRVL